MSHRLLSLDVFRGITIFFMLIVNNPGSWGHIYPAFKHAKWHGFGGADWIFPFFLFIIGFAIPISFEKYLLKGNSKLSLIRKIIIRSLFLFMFGIFLNGFPDFNWDTIRIPGVLQRISLVYFFSAILSLFIERKLTITLFISFLLLHWYLLTQIPVPPFGKPSLEIGKNLAGWIDYSIFPNHLWVHSKTWDPEGILGTISSIATCLFGVYYGKIFLIHKKFTVEQFYFGFFLGILLVSLSFLWDIVFPINKSLWTGSFVLLNSGLAIICLHLLYQQMDVEKKWNSLRIFEIFGVNALGAFFLSSLGSKVLNIPFLVNAQAKEISLKTYLFNQFFITYFSPYNASLCWAILYTFFWFGIFSILYKRKIIFKL